PQPAGNPRPLAVARHDGTRRQIYRQTHRREIPVARSVELYDLQSDPDEIKNLAEDPKYADIRRGLVEKLLARLRATNDNWLERYELLMPGEKPKVGVLPPKGYAPPRKKSLE